MDIYGTTPPDFGADEFAGEEAAPPAPSYLQIKKRLFSETARLTLIANELVNLDPRSTNAPTADAAAVLASVKLDIDLSALDVEALGDTLVAARQGKLNSLCKGGAKITAEEIAVLEAAYKAVLAMDAAGQPTVREWSNLPPSLLARRINRHAHGFFKGRLPGWKD